MGQEHIISHNDRHNIDKIIESFHKTVHSADRLMGIVFGSLNPQIFGRDDILEGVNNFLSKYGHLYLISNSDELRFGDTALGRLISDYKENVEFRPVQTLPMKSLLVTDDTLLYQGGGVVPILEAPSSFPSFTRDLTFYKADTKFPDSHKKHLMDVYEALKERDTRVLKKTA